MDARWLNKAGGVIDLPPLSAVITREGRWQVALCPELGVASQGRTRQEAHAMLGEAVALWLEEARA